MICLPDVNVWIALAAEKHSLHSAARDWFSTGHDEKLVFCRITQAGFLRLLTNKHVMQDEVMSPDQAWDAYRVLRSDRRIGYLPEPERLTEVWDSFTKGRLTSPSLWTDAYLCAFAYAARLTLVTFDGRMPVRDGLNCLVLSHTPDV